MWYLATVSCFPGDSDGKESACSTGNPGWIPGSEEPLEKTMVTHSSSLAWENPMDKGAWWTAVHGVGNRHKWATKHSTAHVCEWVYVCVCVGLCVCMCMRSVVCVVFVCVWCVCGVCVCVVYVCVWCVVYVCVVCVCVVCVCVWCVCMVCVCGVCVLELFIFLKWDLVLWVINQDFLLFFSFRLTADSHL